MKLRTARASPSALLSSCRRSIRAVTPCGSARISGNAAGYRAAACRCDGVRLGKLGDQDAPIGLVAPLQSEVLAPVQQQIGRGVGAQDVAQAVELDGILLVEDQRLHVELVQQDQSPLAIGPVDRLGVPAESLRQPRHHLAHPRRGRAVTRQQARPSAPDR